MLTIEFRCSGTLEIGESGTHQVMFKVVDTPENRAVFGGQVPRGEMVLIGLPEVAHVYQARQRVTIEAPGNEGRNNANQGRQQ
jgi:hypothetical protein